MSDLLSPQQLADYLGVPIRTIYSWNHEGTGPSFIRVGRHVRYRRDVIEEWLNENTVGSTPEPQPPAKRTVSLSRGTVLVEE